MSTRSPTVEHCFFLVLKLLFRLAFPNQHWDTQLVKGRIYQTYGVWAVLTATPPNGCKF